MAVDSAVDERGTLAQPRVDGRREGDFQTCSEIKMSDEYLGGKR